MILFQEIDSSIMDNIEDYGGHADMVLSGLRDAVGTADEKILKLQMELELLEKKAQNEEMDNLYQRISGMSELSDEELGDIENTSQDDQTLTSQGSSLIPINAATTSTKMFDDTAPAQSLLFASEASDLSTSTYEGWKELHPVQSDHEDSSANEKEINKRWGCLKRVFSDERSDDSQARNELFKQILQATQKKHGVSCTKKKPMSPLPVKSRMAYDGLFSTRGNNSGTSTATTSRKKRKSKLPQPNSRHSSDQITSSLTSANMQESQHNTDSLQEMREENHRLQRLLSEEKKHSDKLGGKISDLEKDVEELQTRIELKKHENSTGQIAELVEEIHKAQKLREDAMLERINVASRDRDDAIMRAKAMLLKNTSAKSVICDKEKRDQTMMDLVDRISDADSATVVERYGNELLERMNNLKNAKSRITEEEMAIVMRERDDAVAKCHNLEHELTKYMEKLTEAKKSQKISINTHLKEKVLSTEEDCKKAHSRLHDAEEEIKNLKSSYRFFKSRANCQDEELAKKYSGCLRNIQAEADMKSDIARKLERKNQQLLDKLNKCKVSMQSLKQQNEKLRGNFSISQEKCGKLERLVRVLRKKLISQAQQPMASHE